MNDKSFDEQVRYEVAAQVAKAKRDARVEFLISVIEKLPDKMFLTGAAIEDGFVVNVVVEVFDIKLLIRSYRELQHTQEKEKP